MIKGPELLKEMGGLHSFMHWDGGLLTDSGGFQMVSLLKLSHVTEEGVKFQSPHDQSEMLLSPEKSIEIQNSIGENFPHLTIISMVDFRCGYHNAIG